MAHPKPSTRVRKRDGDGSGTRTADAYDPLDAAGALPSPLTGRPYSAERGRWAATWSKFPLYADKAKLRALSDSFDRNSVTIVVSGTGSGKTVLAVPLMLARMLEAGRPGRVGVTIPKRTTVLAAAQTGAMTLDVPLGEEVGYQFRGAPPTSWGESTKLLYATDGTLLVQSRRDPMLREFSAVVVDEAHERPVPTDLLLAALRGALGARPELRLAVMSATIDPAVFVRYFEAAGLSVGLVEVAGQPNHPIERRFSPPQAGAAGGHLAAGLAAVRRVFEDMASGREPSGNVLLFVPLTKDTTGGCKQLGREGGADEGGEKDGEKRRREGKGGEDAAFPAAAAAASSATCVPLYGKMSAAERDLALAPPPASEGKGEGKGKGKGKGGQSAPRLYIATNVAESSLTIPDLRHVIDTGLQLVSEWDAQAHGTRVAREMATQAQITQRIGRAGRTAPGVAHLLYTQAQLDAQPVFPRPAMLSIDFSETLLQEMSADGSRGPAWFVRSLITPPSVFQLADAVATLHFYGLLSAHPLGTPMGAQAQAPPPPSGTVPGGPAPGPPLAPPVPFSEMPYARLRLGGPKNTQADAVVANALTAALLTTHTYRPTRFGRLVSMAMDRLKLGLPNALLVAAGAVRGADVAADAGELALLLEACGGELGSLWLEASGPRPRATFRKEQAGSGGQRQQQRSDHAALLRIFRTRVSPAGGPGDLVALGLAPGPWLSVRDAVRSSAGAAAAFAQRFGDELRQLCPPRFRSLTVGGSAGLESAVAVSRGFNIARSVGGGRAVTLGALRPTRCEVRPLMQGSPAPVPAGALFVFEQLMLGGAAASVSGVTVVSAGDGARAPRSAKRRE